MSSILHRVISDPVKTRRLLSVLENARASRGGHNTNDSSGSSNRARTPTRNNRTAITRAIDHDDADTDEEFSPGNLSDTDESDREN